MAPSRIEPATYRFVAQCLNQMRHQQRAPLNKACVSNFEFFMAVTMKSAIPWDMAAGSPVEIHQILLE
jgi:hypothetical protein